MPHRYLTSYERATQGLVGPSVVEVAEQAEPATEPQQQAEQGGRRSRPRAAKPVAP